MEENQEVEETQKIDESSTDSTNSETVEKGNEEEETTPNKKNKSNFNSLYKKAMKLETSLTARDKELADAKAELEEWRNLNPEQEEENQSNKEVDSLKLSIDLLKTPEAEPHLKEVQATMKEYGCNFNKAWKLVKVDLPEESKSTTEFNIWKNVINTKDLSKVSPEDALKLSPEKQREWRKINLK